MKSFFSAKFQTKNYEKLSFFLFLYLPVCTAKNERQGVNKNIDKIQLIVFQV